MDEKLQILKRGLSVRIDETPTSRDTYMHSADGVTGPDSGCTYDLPTLWPPGLGDTPG
ncbi:hypothetical protein PGTUg99_023348 [Puccinia graminis f. sp. tritici]|uniref:Uncharacterized protein n=1 Tax=Puccinia graminis f. sp. tritici TaxID=56615 RepID=A0A5B0Q7P1_PUCGR|nr:hypothetical protein PGTUg99_023348 [Puccinia graminis f. sp. tritici]